MAASNRNSSRSFRFPASALVAHAAVITGVTAAAYSGALPSVQHWKVLLWVLVACALLSSCLFTASRMRSESGWTYMVGAGCLGFAGGLMFAMSILRDEPEPDVFLVAGVISLVGMLVTLLLGLWTRRAPRA